jgi:hypothetical protein
MYKYLKFNAMNRQILILLIFSVICLNSFSQAGYGVYTFMDLPVSSRIAALGGTNVSLRDNDINFAFRNPALLTHEASNTLGLNYSSYIADIQFGSAVYAHSIDSTSRIGIGMQYIDYGLFKATDEADQSQGTFSAKDYALNVIYAKQLTPKITIGGTFKPIYSALERYTSFGVALDAGISYHNPATLFSAGLVVRNVGTQLKGYYAELQSQHYEPLPINVEAGVTQKFAHAPIRLSLTLHNLQHFDLNYQSTNQPNTSITNINSASTPTTDKSNNVGFVDMAFRHTILGLELLPGKNFYVSAAYNHRRHQEMSVNGYKSLAGFSFGAGIKLYKFQVGFAWTQFQPGIDSYQFSISTSLNEFRM